MVRSALLSLCIAAGSACLAAGTASNAIDLQLRTGDDPLWRTATNASFEVCWRFPAGATVATLAVTGMSVAVEHAGLTTTSKVLEIPVPAAADEEEVLSLSLTFDNGEAQRASVAVVRGQTCAASATTGWVRAGSRFWARAGRYNVLPVPAGTKTLSVDGVVRETGLDGAAGWYGWTPAEKGRSYTLSVAGGEFEGESVVSWQSLPGLLLLVK